MVQWRAAGQVVELMSHLAVRWRAWRPGGVRQASSGVGEVEAARPPDDVEEVGSLESMCRSFLLAATAATACGYGECPSAPPFSSSPATTAAAPPLAPAPTMLKKSAWLKLEPRGVGLRDDCSE